MDQLVPSDATRMECLVVHETLQRIRQKTLTGIPSGQVIDQAIDQTLQIAQEMNQNLEIQS